MYFHEFVSVVSFYRLSVAGTNLRTEPKHIVFLSQLLLLLCLQDRKSRAGGQASWNRGRHYHQLLQPQMPQTGKYQAWSAFNAIFTDSSWKFPPLYGCLLTGSSATKVFQVFKHMGLCCVSLNTFFKYQRENAEHIRYTGIALKSVEANQKTTSTYTRGT